MSLWIFVAGLILSIIGFLLGNIERLPFVMRVVWPAYAKAVAAVAKLERLQNLGPDDKGFAELAGVFRKLAAEQNPPEAIASISVLRISREPSTGIAFTSKGVVERLPIRFELSSGQIIKWDLSKLRTNVDELKGQHVFVWAVGVFVSGLILQAIGYRADK